VSEIVVDSSAVLAAIKDEPGGDEVERDIRGARISAVNLSEIIGWLAERGFASENIVRIVTSFDLTVEVFDRSRALAAGLLAAQTKRRGISFGDRACLALTAELGLPVVTGDRNWRNLDIGVDVRLFR
jgi:PIN domain nuclease of toxin-antitoxin system